MDDERLLAEALRAHAAGGVSSPTGSPAASEGAEDSPAPDEEPAGGSRLRDRFRPLGRGKRGADADVPESATETTPRPDPSALPGPVGPGGRPRPGGPLAGPGPATPYAGTGRGPAVPGARPGPRPVPPRTPDRPWPQAGPPPARPVPPTGPVARPGGPNVPLPRPAPGSAPTGASRPVAPGPTDGPAPWTATRIAWWSGMALLAGAVAGALAAVGTLGLPG